MVWSCPRGPAESIASVVFEQFLMSLSVHTKTQPIVACGGKQIDDRCSIYTLVKFNDKFGLNLRRR